MSIVSSRICMHSQIFSSYICPFGKFTERNISSNQQGFIHITTPLSGLQEVTVTSPPAFQWFCVWNLE